MELKNILELIGRVCVWYLLINIYEIFIKLGIKVSTLHYIILILLSIGILIWAILPIVDIKPKPKK